MRMFFGHILMTMRMFDGRIRTTKSLMLRNLNINIQITNTIFILKTICICIINKALAIKSILPVNAQLSQFPRKTSTMNFSIKQHTSSLLKTIMLR